MVSGHVCVVGSSWKVHTQPHTGISGAVAQWDGANAVPAGTSSPQLKEEMNQLEALQKALMDPTPCLNGGGELLVKFPRASSVSSASFVFLIYGLCLMAFGNAFGM